jgi:hypothetical protein
MLTLGEELGVNGLAEDKRKVELLRRAIMCYRFKRGDLEPDFLLEMDKIRSKFLVQCVMEGIIKKFREILIGVQDDVDYD